MSVVYDRNGVEIKPGDKVRVKWPYYFINIRVDEGVVRRVDEHHGVTIDTDKPVPHFNREGFVVHDEPWTYFPAEYDYQRRVWVAYGLVGDPHEHGQQEIWIEVI